MPPVTTGMRVASHDTARADLAVQPRGAVAASLGGGRAVGRPPDDHLPDPLILQDRPVVQGAQLGQRHMRPDPDRLAGPLGEQAAGDQAAHRVLERIVVALFAGPGVLGPGRGRQGLQHRGHHRRALRRQVPGDHACPVEGGLHPELAVLEAQLRVIVLLVRQGPGVDLRSQGGQVVLVGPVPRRGHQDLIGGLAAGSGQLVGPLADDPGHRLGQHGPFGQRHDHQRVCQYAAGPAQVPAGRALGHLRAVDQPGSRAVVRVVGVTLPGGERGQDPGPRRGGDRVGLLQALQALGLGLGGQGGGVGGGQVAQAGQDHIRRLGGAGRSGDIHLVLTSPFQRSSQAGPSGPTVVFGSLFESSILCRHFPETTRPAIYDRTRHGAWRVACLRASAGCAGHAPRCAGWRRASRRGWHTVSAVANLPTASANAARSNPSRWSMTLVRTLASAWG